MSFRRWILTLSVVWAVAACTVGDGWPGRSQGEPCDRIHPCSGDLVCRNDLCVPLHDAAVDVEDDLDDTQDAVTDVTDVVDVTDADADADTCQAPDTPCGTDCCSPAEICMDEQCVTGVPCESDGQCAGDTYCWNNLCVPYGTGPRGHFNPQCGEYPQSGIFSPFLHCTWSAPPAGDPYPAHVNVLSTPLVADFDFDGNPAVVQPSIVFLSYSGTDGSSGYYNGNYGVIRVLDGRDCTQLYTVGTQLNGCNTPAIADLDGDGRPEIVAHNGLGGVEAFRYDDLTDTWGQLWHGHNAGGTNLTYGAQSTGWSGVAVHDLNDDGLPEILSFGLVYDHTGLQLTGALGMPGYFSYPAAADLDRDGRVDLAGGSVLYSFNPSTSAWDLVWNTGPAGLYVAYGDFGTFPQDPGGDDRRVRDGIAEIVVVGSGLTQVINVFGRTLYGPYNFPAGTGGGPPTAGDFDGDGRVEFSAASSDSISVFDPDCLGIPEVATCVTLRTDGILWHQVSQDHSSNRTGSSLFDFEGDGRVEVVYADEVFTRVYDGRTGEVLFSQWHSSCTWNENPIVADVDGDYNAELVVPSNLNCTITPTTAGGIGYPLSHNGTRMDPIFKGLRCETHLDCASGSCDTGFCRCADDAQCGGGGSGYVCDVPVAGTPGTGNVCRSDWLGAYPGVRVYRDSLDRWVPSRTIWNQHTYSVSNVSEAGIVPRTAQWVQNWMDATLNNFRQNVQGSVAVGTSPDLTVRAASFSCLITTFAELQATVCNRGTQPVPTGLPVGFFHGQTGEWLCEATLQSPLVTGQCVDLTCEWTSPPRSLATSVTVTVQADADASGNPQLGECNELNNTATVPGVYCEVIGKLR
ncbi:hypothetical protein KKD52_07870 [Myxococcota bacterium]|nr:hypothetical protein [Myxococcota bacterium]MBU1412274.1 hypothetical protein [Myxococcota bacterium]MBU1510266.1 hypothetical protein [Myxococcota bacterium]